MSSHPPSVSRRDALHRIALASGAAVACFSIARRAEAAALPEPATWADGLITINTELSAMRDIVAAYRDNGGTGPLALQVHVSQLRRVLVVPRTSKDA